MNMRKYLLISLGFLFFSVEIVSSQEVDHFTIPQIDDASVDVQVATIEDVLKQNDILRKTIFYAGVTAAAGGAAHLLYQWFLATPSGVQPSEFVSQAKQLLESGKLTESSKLILEKIDIQDNEIGELQKRVDGTRRWSGLLRSSLFSKIKSFIEFSFHTIATSVAWNQFITLQRYCKAAFKDRDLKWYLAMHTRLGSFINFEDIEGNPQERFERGQLLKELEDTAQRFDEEVMGNTQDIHNLALMLRSTSVAAREMVVKIIAYMKYTAMIVVDQVVADSEIEREKKSEALSYACYLRSHFNSFAKSISQCIKMGMNESEQMYKAINIVDKFINDLRITLIGFSRIQQDMQAKL